VCRREAICVGAPSAGHSATIRVVASKSRETTALCDSFGPSVGHRTSRKDESYEKRAFQGLVLASQRHHHPKLLQVE